MLRTITRVTDKGGVTQTTNRGILHTFVEFLQSKYDPIQVDDARDAQMKKTAHKNLPLPWMDSLQPPITEEQLKAPASKTACNKTPGREGICPEFFKVNWDSIRDDTLALFNQIYLDVRIME